ncbi:hypothetical protein F7R91_25110 [Streptomyces luteolifulvus]|uniref:Uncharacterized protein n=1 Tax=Streptomyces luteolifulvus TaxID=2615112 RepID=A0A6H9UVT1_9ACTN|nr:hypothetical protein F7R91_25110 [Streptomyces luteolifulvus]
MDRRSQRQTALGVEPVRAGTGRQARSATPASHPIALDGAPATTAPATTASAAARTGHHHHDQAAAAPHSVDHPDRGAALTPAQQAATVHVHQQAAMPEEYYWASTAGMLRRLTTPTPAWRNDLELAA